MEQSVLEVGGGVWEWVSVWGGVLQGDMLPPSRGKAQERQRHMKDLIS